MRGLSRPGGRVLAATVLAGAVLAGPALAAGPARAGSAGSGCSYSFQAPNSWVLHCSGGSSSPGSPGSGGSSGAPAPASTKLSCALAPLTSDQTGYLGLPAAPKGSKWEAVSCPGHSPFGGVTLVGRGHGQAQPAVTPQEMMQYALSRLRVPPLRPGTAPPLGRDGLVGLPEWYWVPAASWHPVSVTASAAGVWATVTATPQRLTFYPGGGLPAAACAGPGVSYARARSAARACTYTYSQSSARQPGAAYRASVAVTWRVTWTGSGGTGGTINPAEQIGYPFGQRVAEGQALVRGG